MASLGTCAGIFIKSFCNQRDISADNIYITQDVEFDHSKKLISKINLTVFLPNDFPIKYKPAVISAANLCLVKRHLKETININVDAVIV